MSREEAPPGAGLTERDGSMGKDSRGGWRRWMGVGLVLLALALVAGFGSYTVSLLTLIEEQGRTIGLLRKDEAERTRQLHSLLSADRSELLHLNGPSGKDGWRGTMIWDPGTRRAFLSIAGIAMTDTAMQYHLWLIGKSGPTSVTGFTVPANGVFSRFVEQFPEQADRGGAIVVTTDPGGSGTFGSGSLVLAGTIPTKH